MSYMTKIGIIVLGCLLFTTSANAQQCHSENAKYSGGWKSVASAPRDGTIVEMMQTYGIAPWYGLFKWDGGRWISATDPNRSVGINCLYWREYKATGKYVDPTGGAQDSVAYWCAHAGAKYDAKNNKCVAR